MSRRRVHKHAAAKASLAETATYLAAEAGLEVGLRFLDEAARTFEFLLHSPGVGRGLEASDPRLAGLRVWPVSGFENWLVFYRDAEDGIVVVAVMHGARDLETRLGERLSSGDS